MIQRWDRWTDFAFWPLDPGDPMVEVWVAGMAWREYL